MSWLHDRISSPYGQIATTAVITAVSVSSLIFGIQALQRQANLEDLKASIPDEVGTKIPDLTLLSSSQSSSSKDSKEDARSALLASRALQGDYDNELIAEQLTRTNSFLTPSGLAKVRSAFVIVVGLGGVGSHCVAALARSGISKIRVIDFDQVTLSSLNRHSVATLSDVGTPKVETVRRRIQAIAPWIEWEVVNEVWRLDASDRLLGTWNGNGQAPDYVVDAIDNIDSKVALLNYCHERSIKVISSMGSGCKSDPTRVLLADISESIEDPLSKSTRRRLRIMGVNSGIPVVYSTEKPGPGKATLLPLSDEEFNKGNVGELSVLPDFRSRILPVLGTMPAVFGLVVANYILLEISGYPHESATGKARENTYEGVLKNVQAQEEKILRARGWNGVGLKIPVTRDDVAYLLDEVFRGRSVVSGLSTRLTLTRWQRPEGKADEDTPGQKTAKLRLSDLVCMTREETAVHEKSVLLGEENVEDLYDMSVLEKVKLRRDEEEAFSKYR